ncbi:hypothetical protein [Streptomyces sp. NPDC052107]|uniref:hypothetical protein n=1 Tax=Streptomyces sp. NPDC052107 TaxID=3155632 RepID=UPI0034171848
MDGVPARRTRADYAVSGRRAVRVTLVAAAGFYLFRYGLDRPVAAIYALFAAVALGGLAKIPGTGRQRAATVLRLLPVCWLLVAVGTYLSVRTWSAVVGMLAVGFALAFAAVGGPRPAGAAPGLQLLYILPSFPPYAPGTLGERLIGTSTGLVLFIVAEALILPEPGPPSYRERAAHAVRTAAHDATLLAAPPYALTDPDIRAAWESSRSLRSLTVPEAERPAGAGLRDRALAHTGLATRTLLSRLAQLPGPPGGRPGPEVTAALQAVARLATATADCLGTGPSPVAPYEDLVRARAHLSALSAGPAPAGNQAADLAVRGRHAAVETAQGRFWYAGTWAPILWWHRLRGHAGRRSVCFQNAVRIALALTAARLVAGVDTLPHGF